VTAGAPPAPVQDGPDVVFEIRVQPRASRDELCLRTLAFTLRLAAPPVDGAANLAACRFLADLLDVPRSRVLVDRGQGSRHKRVRVRQARAEDVAARLLAAARQGR
jgi:uncharacterized protein YggU (UPF0235/DUF167 family)